MRFERLLVALKSKRHKQAQNCYVFGASVRWAFGKINAAGPGIPTLYGWILVVDTVALKAEMTLSVPGGSFIATCVLGVYQGAF